MSAVTEPQILDALRQVIDPDKGSDIVSLRMVSGLVIRDGNVAFAVEVESERGPRLEPLRKAAEKAVEALPNVLSVSAPLSGSATPRSASRTSRSLTAVVSFFCPARRNSTGIRSGAWFRAPLESEWRPGSRRGGLTRGPQAPLRRDRERRRINGIWGGGLGLATPARGPFSPALATTPS